MRSRLAINTLAAATSIAALAALPPMAAGDAVYHTQHKELEAVGGAPLRSGFVQNIKANGPIVYAHEVYVLNGAAPRSRYTVTNHFFVGDAHCADPEKEAPFDTAVLRTNRAGNARADIVLAPADIGGLTGEHSARWTIQDAAGHVVYKTDCSTVTLD